MMLLDPFLYNFVAEHQRTLREAAEDARRGGALGPGWWRLALGVPAVVASRTVPSVQSRRPVCRRLLACRHPSGHALVGHDV
jgi:hypothetical protein